MVGEDKVVRRRCRVVVLGSMQGVLAQDRVVVLARCQPQRRGKGQQPDVDGCLGRGRLRRRVVERLRCGVVSSRLGFGRAVRLVPDPEPHNLARGPERTHA